MATQWKSSKERSTKWLLLLTRWCALNIGRWFVRMALYPICLYYLFFTPNSKCHAKYFLQKVINKPITWKEHYKHYHTFASVILDRVFFLTDQHQEFELNVTGSEIVSELMEQNQGAILLGSHLGSFEALRGLASKNYVPLKVLMHAQSSETISNLLHALNKNIANAIIPMGTPESLLHMKDWLTHGGFVGILADRVYQDDKVVEHNFLGEKARFATGPFRLCQMFNVPIIFFCGLYMGENKYDICFEKIEFNKSDGPEALLSKYIDLLEKYVRKAPYNWFNFYEYWKK